MWCIDSLHKLKGIRFLVVHIFSHPEKAIDDGAVALAESAHD